jgi:hypothetical protein
MHTHTPCIYTHISIKKTHTKLTHKQPTHTHTAHTGPLTHHAHRHNAHTLPVMTTAGDGGRRACQGRHGMYGDEGCWSGGRCTRGRVTVDRIIGSRRRSGRRGKRAEAHRRAGCGGTASRPRGHSVTARIEDGDGGVGAWAPGMLTEEVGGLPGRRCGGGTGGGAR